MNVAAKKAFDGGAGDRRRGDHASDTDAGLLLETLSPIRRKSSRTSGSRLVQPDIGRRAWARQYTTGKGHIP